MKLGKIVGGTLLVSGTTIGAGLLGLPTTCAFMGFYPSVFLFIVVWLFMLATGLFFVDITCDLKKKVNIISMAEMTIGRWGMAVSWVAYLLLLYSLIALYISGSAPMFQKTGMALFGLKIPNLSANFILPVLFGWIIYLGVYGVDIINRYFMIGLVASYLLLVSFLPAHIEAPNLSHKAYLPMFYAIPAIITGFGYHIIIPTLGSYMKYDRKMMISTVVIGSVISLLINILWQFLVLGVLPLSTLAGVWKDGIAVTGALAAVVSSSKLALGVYLFSFFAIITSFLGVSLSLSDFLIDGLKIKKGWEGRLLAISLTFIPPLVFVSTYERGFMMALQYAGAFVAILLVFIPSAMVLKLKGHKFYSSLKGRTLIFSTLAFSVCVIVINILIRWGVFTPILERTGGL